MEDTTRIDQPTDLSALRVTISKDLVYQELDGEMVILDLKSGQYFGIDLIGSCIWQMLEQNIHPADIVERLLQEYEVETDLCRQQVVTFLRELEQNTLISCIPHSPGQ